MSHTVIDPSLTLNEITVRHPITLSVLRDYGFDTCCGGALPLAEAARRHKVDEGELRAALERAVAEFDAAVSAAVNKGDIA
jgi:iron-sulfur cluster repair protein YtfE (RIC family)